LTCGQWKRRQPIRRPSVYSVTKGESISASPSLGEAASTTARVAGAAGSSATFASTACGWFLRGTTVVVPEAAEVFATRSAEPQQ
jgi:hypothetical protein